MREEIAKLTEELEILRGRLAAAEQTELAESSREDVIRRMTAHIELLQTIDDDILNAKLPKEIALTVLRQIRNLIPSQRASVAFMDFHINQAEIFVEDQELVGEKFSVSNMDLSNITSAVEVLQKGEIFQIEDIQEFSPNIFSPEVLNHTDFRSGIMAPLIVQSELIGSLNLSSDQPNAFEMEHLSIVRDVANSLAVALQQARLYQSAAAQKKVAQVLAESARDLSSSNNLEYIFDLTLDRLKEVLPYDSATLILLQKDGPDLITARGIPDLTQIKIQRADAGDGFPLERDLVLAREPIILGDVRLDDRWVSLDGLEYIRAWMGVPLVAGEEVLGYLMLDKADVGFYTPASAELVAAFSFLVATAIQNVRLFETEWAAQNQSATLGMLTTELTESLDLDQVLDRILTYLETVIPYDTASVMLMSEGRVERVTKRNFRGESMLLASFSSGATAYLQDLLRQQKPRIIRDTDADPKWKKGPETDRIGCWLGVPLVVKGKSIGLLSLDRAESNFYGEQAKSVVMSFANQAALAIENVRLFGAMQQQREQLAQTLEISEALHRGLELSQVLEHIAQGVRDLGFQRVTISVREPDQDYVTVRTARGMGKTERELLLGATYQWTDFQGLMDERFKISRSYLIRQDLEALDGDPDANDGMDNQPIRGRPRWRPEDSLLVPLRGSGGVAIGLLSVDDPEDGRIPDLITLQTLESVASQAAIAIENARLFEAERRQADQLEVLRQLGLNLTAQLDLDVLLETIVQQAVELLAADSGGIYIYRPDRNVIEWMVAIGPEMAPTGTFLRRGEGVSGKVWDTGKPILVDDYRRWDNKASIYEGFAWASVLAVPVSVGDEFVGVLDILAAETGSFSQSDINLLTLFANQAAVAIANARLFEQVRIGRERLQALSEKLLNVQENERRRIALELHDQIGQTLTAVKINLQAAQRIPEIGQVGDIFEQNIAIVDRALQQVRSLSLELRPAMLDDLGLIAALRWYVDRQAQGAGFKAEFVADPLEPRPSQEIETACFRVAQEALTNVVRHAEATSVRVILRLRAEELQLIIREDGIGFDVNGALTRAARGESMGLLGMQERTQLLGGKLEIEAQPGKGSVITARFPLKVGHPLERRHGSRPKL
jgi:GAF domain-containing protein